MPSFPLKLALIGAGRIAKAHIRGALAHPDKLSCVAICDPSRENAGARTAELGTTPAIYANHMAMLEEMGSEIDAVLLALPHLLHTESILDCIRANKPMLSEKPLCITLEDADRIVDAVSRSGVVFMPAHNTLFTPAVRRGRELIDSGLIGRVQWLRTQDCIRVRRFDADQWRARERENGGGELIDMGFHPVYRLLYLAADEVASVRGSLGRFRLDQIEGDDTACLQVRFAKGAIGEVMTSWAFAKPFGGHDFHVIGSEGQLFGGRTTIYHLAHGWNEPARMDLPDTDVFSDQIAHFADCVVGCAQPLQNVVDARTVLRVILGAMDDAAGWRERAQVRWVGARLSDL